MPIQKHGESVCITNTQVSVFHRVETNAHRTGYNYTSWGGTVGVGYTF